MARPTPRLSSQAQLNAVLRYAPERQALAQAVSEARSEHNASIAGAESAAREQAGAVAAATPAVSGIYDRAQASSGQARSQLGGVLASLGTAAAPAQGAAANEAVQGAEKTARERATAETDLRSQSLATAQAPAFARTLADSQLSKTLSKIFSSAQSVAGQEGTDVAAELAREDKENRQDALTKRGQNITATDDAASRSLQQQGLSQKATEHQEDLAAGQYSKAGAAADKPRLLSQDKLAAAASTLREIEHEARGLKGSGLGRKAIFAELTNAHGAYNVPKKDESGDVLKNSKGEVQYEKAPSLPAHDALLAEAALDSVYGYGRVSKATLAKLHNAGYSIKALQLQGPPPPKATVPGQVQSTAPGSRISTERQRRR